MKVGDLVRTKGNDGALWLVTQDSEMYSVRCRSLAYPDLEVCMGRMQLEVINESR
jgi:hypothetical protein